jgi:hypothetical protein
VLSFALANDGNIHVLTTRVHVTGRSASRTLFERSLDDWYVLSGARRQYRLPLDGGDCASVRTIEVKVATPDRELDARLDSPGGACRSGSETPSSRAAPNPP